MPHLLADIPQKALITHNGKVLVVFDAIAKIWELPGGRVEVGEEHNLPAALAREIREELGAEIRVGRVIDMFVFEGNPPHCVVTYECELVGGPESIKIDGVEVGEVRWVSEASEVVNLPMQPGYKSLLQKVLKSI
jgi:8-oxo-dGTP pyrophosphatase MutT (NUDIX family)